MSPQCRMKRSTAPGCSPVFSVISAITEISEKTKSLSSEKMVGVPRAQERREQRCQGTAMTKSRQPVSMLPAEQQALRRQARALARQQVARAHRGVAEIGEHAIDAEAVELQILLDRVELIVGGKELRLVAERVRVQHE